MSNLDHDFRYVADATGGFQRGDCDITPSELELPWAEAPDTWGALKTWMRAQYNRRADAGRKRRQGKACDRTGAAIRQWEKDNPAKAKAGRAIRKDRRQDRDYLKDVVALDSEGYATGDTWYRSKVDGQVLYGEPDAEGWAAIKRMIGDDPTLYFEGWQPHETFMWASSRVSHAEAMAADFSATNCEPTDYLIDPKTTDKRKIALDPRAVLEWLVGRRAMYGDALYVMFSFGYDVAQIIKHFDYVSAWEISKQQRCPLDKVRASHKVFRDLCKAFPELEANYVNLHNLETYAKKKPAKKGFHIVYGRGHAKGFAIKYRDRRELEIWKLTDPDKPLYRAGDKKPNFDRKTGYIRIFDVFGFFGVSFAKVTKTLRDMGKASPAEYQYMTEMKASRDQFAEIGIENVKRYTRLELVFLGVIVATVRWSMAELDLPGLSEKGLRLNAWYGAGAASGAFIRQYEGGINQNHYGESFEADFPYPQQLAAHASYKGGRAELLMQGYLPPRACETLNGDDEIAAITAKLKAGIGEAEWDAQSSDLWQADISSAYPYIMAQLPSMGPRRKNGERPGPANGRKRTMGEAQSGGWTFHREPIAFNSLAELRAKIEDMNIVSLFYVEYSFPGVAVDHLRESQKVYTPFFPFLYRTQGKKILCPPFGRGWENREDILGAIAWLETFVGGYDWRDFKPVSNEPRLTTNERVNYSFEIKKGKPVSKLVTEKLPPVTFKIHRYWRFDPQTDEKPFKIIEDLYERRRAIVDKLAPGQVNIMEQVIKLIINSMYGKLAQSVGGVLPDDDDPEGEAYPPSTTNPYYAAAITAGTRRMLIEAACRKPYAVVSFATDALVSSEPLDDLPNVYGGRGKGPLGTWQVDKLDGGLFIGSGFYVLWTMEKNAAGKVELQTKLKTRGTDQRAIAIDAKRNARLVAATLRPWMKTEPNAPIMRLHTKKFMTIGMALASPQSWPLAGMFSVPLDHPFHLQRRVNLTTPGDKREYLWPRFEYYQCQMIGGKKTYSQRCYKLVPTIPVSHRDGLVAESKSLPPKWARWDKPRVASPEALAAKERAAFELEAERAEVERIEGA